MTPTSIRHFPIAKTLAAAGLVACLAAPAQAFVNFEEPDSITDKFMATCSAQQTESTCRCAMGRLIDRITFVSLADAVDEGRADLRKDPQHGSTAMAAFEWCARGEPVETVEAQPR
jgi:hypothetical protein